MNSLWSLQIKTHAQAEPNSSSATKRLLNENSPVTDKLAERFTARTGETSCNQTLREVFFRSKNQDLKGEMTNVKMISSQEQRDPRGSREAWMSDKRILAVSQPPSVNHRGVDIMKQGVEGMNKGGIKPVCLTRFVAQNS